MNVLTIAGKELHGYFTSPLAYMVIAGFLLITGIFFSVTTIFSQEANMRFVLENFRVVLLFVTPLITMRLLAEEQSTGTIELLLTSPVRDIELVLGKFLGAMGLIAVMLLITLYYPFLLFIYGKPDVGPIISGYLGLLLMCGAFTSLGLLMSAFTKNQIVAAILGFAVLLLFWLAGPIGDTVRGQIGDILKYLSSLDHYSDFARGVIDTRDVVYYLTITIAALFITVRVVETRRSF